MITILSKLIQFCFWLVLLKKNRLHIQRMLELAILTLMLIQPFLDCVPTVVEADPGTIYVPDDHPTIQYAIGNATAGDTIIVRSGTYRESIWIDKQLTIQGEDKETTFIDGMNNGDVVWIAADGVQFFEFTLLNASDDGIYLNDVNGTVIYECIICNCSDEGIYAPGSDNTSIENCTIYGMGDYGIYLSVSHDAFIAGCDIYNNSDDGIYVWNSKDALITGCEVYDILSQGIYVSLSHRTRIVDCDIYNNTSQGINLQHSDNTWIMDCDIYNNSGWEAIYVSSSDNTRIVGSRIYDNYYTGVDLYGSDNTATMDCEIYNNGWDGMYVSYSDNALIEGCSIFNNDDGIELGSTDRTSIRDCSVFENGYKGIYFSGSDITTICNSTVYNNSDGIYSYASLKTYIARSAIFNNSDDGLYVGESSGVIVNSNFTDNNDGINSYKSNYRATYCSIEGNDNYGIYGGELTTFNATESWWGNETGPYHGSLNPAGTGDMVTEYIEFDPWQTELYQPDILLSDLRCRRPHAGVNSVYYVPTGNIYDDSTFYAFYAYKVNTQIITPPTQSPGSSAFLDVDGSPLFDGDIVTFGGKFANRLVAYYEDAGLAKIGFANNGTHRIFRRISDGAHVYAVDSSTYNESEKDYFVFQIYADGDRYILTEWGIRAPGTYAGGICYIDIILPRVGSFTDSYFVFSWTDLNGDIKPQPEEIAVEASGN